jgi:hypothetical protein
MPCIAYVYIPGLSIDDVREVFGVLHSFGFQITHIGKIDLPKRRAVSYDKAAALVVQASGGATNWTFVRDERSAVDLDFQIRSDPRWGFSTVSISFPESIPDRDVCTELFRRLGAFACVSGVEGAGKDQPWTVQLISEACPDHIKRALGANG